MKNLFILLIAVCWCQNTLSAQGYSIIYERVQHGGYEVKVSGAVDPAMLERLKSHKNITNHHLRYKNGVSNYFWDRKVSALKDKMATDEIVMEERTGIKVNIVGNGKLYILYKDLASGQYLENHDLGKPVLIKDKLPTYDWKIHEETKVIGEYVCKKATAQKGKDEITAWYAVSIPIQDGPSKYYGLPGLIIDLKHQNHTYRAISVKETPDVEITVPNEKKVMSQAEYDKKKKELNSYRERILKTNMRD